MGAAAGQHVMGRRPVGAVAGQRAAGRSRCVQERKEEEDIERMTCGARLVLYIETALIWLVRWN
jgi:hypothetical protein